MMSFVKGLKDSNWRVFKYLRIERESRFKLKLWDNWEDVSYDTNANISTLDLKRENMPIEGFNNIFIPCDNGFTTNEDNALPLRKLVSLSGLVIH